MTTKEFRTLALKRLKESPGLTRMEWFNACIRGNKYQKSLWHTFKFQVAMVLIMGGQVVIKSNTNDESLDLFFPVGY